MVKASRNFVNFLSILLYQCCDSNLFLCFRQERILRRARTEDLSSIAKTGCLYRSGQDRLGRQVVVVIGKWFRPDAMDLDKAFLYLVKLLDDINGEYSVVYFHTSTGAENRPSFRWMRAVYDNMEYRFKKNLKSLCIVHPTVWTKVCKFPQDSICIDIF